MKAKSLSIGFITTLGLISIIFGRALISSRTVYQLSEDECTNLSAGGSTEGCEHWCKTTNFCNSNTVDCDEILEDKETCLKSEERENIDNYTRWYCQWKDGYHDCKASMKVNCRNNYECRFSTHRGCYKPQTPDSGSKAEVRCQDDDGQHGAW